MRGTIEDNMKAIDDDFRRKIIVARAKRLFITSALVSWGMFVSLSVALERPETEKERERRTHDKRTMTSQNESLENFVDRETETCCQWKVRWYRGNRYTTT